VENKSVPVVSKEEAMMKMILLSLMAVMFLAAGSLAVAQTGGGEMMGGTGRGYGMMGGYLVGWVVYGLIKAAVVVFGLWILLRIARAVEKIAASKS
jgi:uncharacterized membrane protein